jgi:two-component system sensor histidine kinase YesM
MAWRDNKMFTYLKNKLSNMKIFGKMFLACLLVTISISLISGGITYRIASQIIMDKTIRQTEETVAQISENYDTFMNLIYNKLDYLAFEPTVQEELIYGVPGEDEEGYYSGTRKLKRLMVQMFNSIQMEDIEIYGDNNKNYFCSVSYQEPKLPNESELMQTARENMGAIVCVNDIENSGCLQVVKQIKDILSMQSLGILRNAIRLSALENIQKNVDFASEGTILLLDDNDKIILGEESEFTQKAGELLKKWDDSFNYEINGKSYQIIYRTSDYTGWKTIGIISTQEIAKSAGSLLIAVVVTLIVGILLGLLLSALLSYVLVRPIKNTVKALNIFADGDFSVRLEENREDEYGEVNRVFNSTIKRVEGLLEEITHSRVLNKEMEFKALQAQINPHFLYNALDTVNWMAHKRGEEEICDMIRAVSNLLRISISNKETVFTIQKELLYVQDYLYIQKTRFLDRFEVVFDVADEVKDQILPKLTIQPLTENCIVHSVEVSRKKVLLRISAYRKEENVYITVEDNGVGMSESIRNELLKEPGKERQSNVSIAHTGLGVYAVHRRLQYMFGEEYGLTVTSQEEKGACFTIKIPYCTDMNDTGLKSTDLLNSGHENSGRESNGCENNADDFTGGHA